MLTSKTVILIEDVDSLYAQEQANMLGNKLGLQVHTVPLGFNKKEFSDADYLLVYTPEGLSLRMSQEPTWGDIRVDFASSALNYRKQHGGGRNEALAKAIGIKGKQNLKVIDCTAGMGVDSFVMASVGAQVTMIERSPIIHALLEDALIRAQRLNLDLCNDMHLLNQNASEYLNELVTNKKALNDESPSVDVIYLDPMFPHKKKSALVKKEMRAFQVLLGPDQDSDQILSAALNTGVKRVVVKRPASAPNLDNQQNRKPSMAIQSKKHRFDVYL